ncbi:uncharacterized protein [Parasteatoda tepidariorum]|uniref:uncharacterized protein n=1 Tax=Parasteatoda tepidariorum TaxID=114398 RepID=UPI001C7227DF|nr:uncharacterized protein LOC107449426 isoform X1 [Parasteatoda tepidariorum]XP_042900763.1 uncharacterized protein LOC107449426 isoform X2 [Parasteatoda tepidariorum]
MRWGFLHHRYDRFNVFIVIICNLFYLISVSHALSSIETFDAIVPRTVSSHRRHERQVNFQSTSSDKTPIPTPKVTRLPRISSLELGEIVGKAVVEIDKRLNSLEQRIFRNGIVLDPGSPSWFAAASAKTKVAAKNVSRMALVSEEASKLLLQQYKLSKDQVLHALPTVDIRGTALEKDCPFMVDFPCRPKKYRAYSGYCNNVQNPRWGNANTGYIRYLAPDYSNNVNNPRESISRQALPSALEVSRLVHSDSERPHPHLTVFLAIFAEFIFHDIFHTSQSAGYRGHRLRCCDVPSEFLHPECFPIIDNKSTRRPQLCVNYVRSSNVPRAGCTLGTREQINQVTSFIDGSVIYGSSEEEVKRLKANQNGLLKIQGHLQLLPPDTANPHDCRSTSTRKCFLAGDVRVNENIGLMVMHTIWVREHNRIAGKLAELNAQWTDEQLFEETRKIVGAELQHITYSELLPVLLGRQVLRQFDLEGQKEATFYQGYDINLNPGTSNAFAAAVGASFYSMMPSHFFRYVQSTGTNRDKTKAKHDTVGSMQIGETHFFPVPLYVDEAFDQFLLGMVNQKAQSMDEFITKEMNNNLVEETGGDRKNDEMDLAAWIIQQGRDHGIPGYIEWRKACRLSPSIQNFTTLSQIMTAEAAENIAKAYADVRDVDLFTGGLSEKPIVGGVVGPTFACILSRQFQHLKRADRFWYENDIPPNSFTKDQLQEIRKTSLARILCDNAGKLVRLLQPSPMLMPDEYLNAYQDCNNTAPALDLTKWKTKSPGYEVPKETLLTSLKEAMRQAIKRIAAEQEVFSRNIGVAPHTSAEAVHHVFLRPKRQAMFIANKSLVLELASLQLIHDVQLKDPEKKPSDLEVANMMLALSSQDVEDYIQLGIRENLPENLEGRCRFEEEHSSLPCDHTTPFRSASGWCNNIQNPQWGKSLVTFQRLLPPRYHDGISAPRSVGASGRDLPSPRLVSTIVHYAIAAPHARYTLALMQWGQFVDHDLTLTPMHEALGRRPLDCKSCDSAKTVHPECWPIPIPPDDPFFPSVHKNSSKNCISFARSLAGQLTLGRREQMNQLTSYLDASNMYGSDACEARMLRTSQGGRLNSTKHPFGGKDLLPLDVTNVECRAPSGVCFESGDIRASEQPGLTSMHTIWMREHNRIAAELERINPHWRDETIYQQARRIVSAMLQHITFTEFAPRVLGEKLMKESELFSSPYKYDPTCDASIFNEFAAAAYRFGHTLLKPAFPRIGSKYEGNSGKVPLQLRTVFFNPEPLYERNAIDEILRGLLSTSVEVFDHSITSEVTNHLFEDRKVPFSGMDLVSLNLQRGRDHGLQGYNAYRVLCNKTRATTFEDLLEDIPQHIVQRLKSVYENVDDIDLFTGGVSETPMYGALVGPTFGCIISMQFNNLKKCDRFWYETQDPFLRFTDDQLAEIRQTKISKVICDNADSIDTVQMMGFELPDDFLNPRMSCKSLPSINLRLWKETNSCNYEVQSNDIVSIPTGHTHRISPCITCSCTKEGMVCQSMKISNCFQLASTYTRERILEDDVCKVQCAFAFRTYPQFESSVNNVLGFTISNN